MNLKRKYFNYSTAKILIYSTIEIISEDKHDECEKKELHHKYFKIHYFNTLVINTLLHSIHEIHTNICNCIHAMKKFSLKCHNNKLYKSNNKATKFFVCLKSLNLKVSL